MLFSQDDNIKVAGTADLIDIDNNVLRDWKSGVYKELTLHHKLQLSAYVVMASQMGLLSTAKPIISGVTCTTNPQNKFFQVYGIRLESWGELRTKLMDRFITTLQRP